MKQGFITANATKKILVLPNSCQTKSILYQANIDCDIAGCKQKCYVG